MRAGTAANGSPDPVVAPLNDVSAPLAVGVKSDGATVDFIKTVAKSTGAKPNTANTTKRS